MRMLPDIIPNSLSNAEKRIFEALKNDQSNGTENWIVLHSLGVSKHHYENAPNRPGKRYGEIDFVILTGEAIVALEVKGGKVSCSEGKWNYTNRFNKTTMKYESPYKQVSDGMFSLESMIKEKFPELQLRFCCGVLLSDMSKDEIPVCSEWYKRPIFTKEYWNNYRENPISVYIKQIINYTKNNIDQHQYIGIKEETRKKLLDFLRPEIDCVPTLFEMAEVVQCETKKLTEEQYRLLDYIDGKHLLIHGGAGSGKTFVALEKARRFALAGKKVLYVCSTPLFCSYLKAKVNEEFFEDNNITLLSLKELSSPAFHCKFNSIILDEAQDFIDAEIIKTLTPLILEDWSNTDIFVFYDKNQVVDYSSFDRNIVQYLKNEYSFTTALLPHNCRNTSQTVSGISRYSNIRYAEHLRDTSNNETLTFVTKAFERLSVLPKRISDALKELYDNKVKNRQITILYDNEKGKNTLIEFLNKNHIKFDELVRDGQFIDNEDHIKIATVWDYKGQENDYIIYILGAEEEKDVNFKTIYLCLSRTKIKPYMFGYSKLAKYLKEIYTRNKNNSK